MESIKWIFSGIGTSILIGIISFIAGGVTGYNIGKNSKIRQKQVAGDNSTQRQTGQIINNGN